ncbi:DUF1398 family protein, partial [Salmonella enterica]|uniref:DUF1398 family protein n=1 Tax=Salmonella enterica TaxID=28901 RepID=UPI00118189FC
MELQLMLNHFFERVRKDANFNAFLIDLEYNNIAYYIYFVATGNVKIITHAGHFISIKSNRKLIKVCLIQQTIVSRIGVYRMNRP